MPFFSGFAGEFGRQLERSRAEEADRAERDNALQSSILQHLATSPDPEIQGHALAGLLDLAGPRKFQKGMAGWLGKVQGSPALPTLRQLLSHGRAVQVPEHVPRMTAQPGMPEPTPGTAIDVEGAPQPISAPSARAGGAGAPGMPLAATPPPPPVVAPGDAYQPPRTVTQPREVFRQPDEQAALTARATAAGTLQGRVDVLRGTGGQPPLSPEEQDLLFPGRALTTAGIIQGKLAPAGALDNAGRPLTPEGYYQSKADPRDPSKMVYFPTTAPASVTNQAAIASRYQITHYVGPDGKTPGAWRVSRDGSKPPQFIGYLPQKGQYLQYVDPDTQEVSYIAAPAVYTPGAPLAGSPQPPAAVAPPVPGGAPGPAPGAAAVPPVAAAAAPVAPGAAGGAARAAPPRPGGPPAHGISGGRKRQLEPAEGALIGPDGAPQVARAFLDKGTGKYYSVQDPTQEAVGFIPGAEGAYATTAYAQANNTLITIAAAKKALEDAGLTKDNDPAHTAALMARFYAGTTGGNPIDAAVASLTNLAGIQGATQYVKSNSRSYQMFQAALQHLPNAPSQRAAALSTLPVVGRVVTPRNAAIAGGHGWDSFQSMYAKLNQAETIIQQGKGALAELTGKTAGNAIGAGANVPPEVRSALQGLGAGRHTLSDGSIWVIDAAGQIRPGG